MRHAKLTLSFIVLMTSLAAPSLAQPPSIGFTLPSAVVPGQPVDVTLFGGNLAGPTQFWTSFPCTVELAPGVEKNGTDAGKVVYRLTAPTESPPGFGALRVATAQGVSNLRLILLDDLATVVDNGANKTPETAQPLTLPVAVDGACEPESYDFYTFTATAGQRLSVEVFARRLGSPLDPVVRLLDSSGRELAYSDDEPGTGADCRFVHEFAADGAYRLEVRDIRYQGGGGHRYRLRLGNFPLTTVAYPLAGKRGATVRLGVVGPAADGVLPLDLAVPADASLRQMFVRTRFAGGDCSSFVPFSVGDRPEAIEFEPNDTPEQSTLVSLSSHINGRFAAAKDRDFFQFDAKKGERYLFAGRTRDVGSPTDLYLRLYKADGAQLAEVDDSGTSEGVIDFTFPEDGTYRLMAEDLHRRGGPEHAYRIHVSPYRPGFSLSLEAETFNAPKGGVFVAKVNAARRDYGGPITLALAGATESFVLGGNVIPENKNETVMSVTLPPGLEPGQLISLNVVGTAKVGDADLTARASTLGALVAQLSGHPYPPAMLDGVVALGIGPVFGDFFKLAVEPQTVQLPQLIGTATFTVKTEKMNGFDDQIALAVEGLPEGIAADAKAIEKGKADVQVTLTAPVALAEADFAFRLVGRAAFQNQPKQVVVEPLVLRVVKPLAISATAAGPLMAGGKQTLKFALTRYGDEKPAVNVELIGLPLGVSATQPLTIPEGQNELTVELTAAPDASIGKAEIRLRGTAQIKGKAIAIESSPVPLEVVMQ